MSLDRSLAIATKADLVAPAALVTASFNSTPVDIREAMGNICILAQFFMTSGTNPTFALVLQTGDASNGSDAVTVSGFAIAAAANGNAKWIVNKAKLKRYVRIAATIGGTSTPTGYVVSSALYFKKYIS